MWLWLLLAAALLGTTAEAAGGRVVAWGRNDEGQCRIPADATNIVDIAATAIHTVALRDDGRLLAWGSPDALPPSGVGGLVRIAAANLHAAGVRADGTVAVWSGFPALTSVPAAATNIVDVSVGNTHIQALRSDGRVLAWGENAWGQLEVPASATNVVKMAAGGVHGMALCADGRLLVWGQMTRVPAAATNLVEIAASFDRCLALRRDGEVFEWTTGSDLEVPAAAAHAVAIAGGASHWLALRWDGRVVAWGLGSGSEVDVPAGLSGVTAVAGGGNHSVAITGFTGAGVQVLPVGATVLAGDAVLFSGEPRGLRPLTWQWFRNGAAVVRAGDSGFYAGDVQAEHAGDYRLEATTSGGSAASEVVRLTVVDTAPRFAGSARAVGLIPGKTLELAPEVRGTRPIAFQWRKNGVEIPGATGSSLTIPEVGWGDAGIYELWASNRVGVTVSPAQTVTIIHVAAWGWDPVGEIDVPPSATNLVAVAAGVNHSLGLREDGTVVGWGDWTFNQIAPPSGASNGVAVAAGGGQSLVLRGDGRLVIWGSNVYGQTNAPASATNLIAIAAGDLHTLAVRQDGRVFAWGYNGSGQCTVPESASNAVAVAGGPGHSLALRSDGTVVAWGSASYGMNTVPANVTNVMAIAAGKTHNLALRSDGTVVGWGSNDAGETTAPVEATNVVAIAAFDYNSLAVRADGRVLTWGSGFYPDAPVPPQATNAVAVSAGSGFDLALLDRGVFRVWQVPAEPVTAAGETLILRAAAFGRPAAAFQWSRDGVVLAGETNAWLVLKNVQAEASGVYAVEGRSGDRVFATAPGRLAVTPAAPSFVVEPAGLVALMGTDAVLTAGAKGSEPIAYEWEFNGQTVPGATGPVLQLPAVTQALAGEYRLVAANALGRATSQVAVLRVQEAVAWGVNWQQQLNVPAEAVHLVEIAAGTAHSLALRADGTVVAWGENGAGQSTVPVSATNVVHVAGRSDRSLALRRDGTLVAWGGNSYGSGTIPPSATNVIAMGLGNNHSMAVRRDGTVVVWGYSASGMLAIPANATNVVAVAGGVNHSLALRADGTVLGWGAAAYGVTNIPASATGVVAIACGSIHNLALRNDGTAVAWGANVQGQCDVPLEATNLLAVAAHEGTSMALRRDGRVFVWGYTGNNLGAVPAQATNAAGIALGAGHAVVLADPGAAAVFAPPLDATVWAGEKLELVADVVGARPRVAQWYWNGEAVAGATNRWLVLPEAQEAVAGAYTVAFVRDGLWVASAPAVVRVRACAPVLMTQPSSQTNWIGARLGLEFGRLGSEPITNLWFRDGTVLPEATGRGLDFPDLALSDAGLYQLVVANALGAATSNPVRIGVRQVVPWGANTAGQTNVHAGATNVIALSAGNGHTLALRADGGVLCWGGTVALTNVPAAATNGVAIAAGYDHNLLARADGTVLAWGSTAYGKTSVPGTATGVVAVAAGATHSLALRRDGTVVTWGNGTSGLGSVPAKAVNVCRIAAPMQSPNYNYSLALRRDGRVVGWGASSSGLTNPPASVSNVVSLSAGSVHALAVRGDGQVVGWGSTTGGGLMIPAAATNVVAVVAGTGSGGSPISMALRNDGTILAWGTTNQLQYLQLPAGLESAFALAVGGSHAVAATASRAPRFVDRLGDLAAYLGGEFCLNALVVGAPPLNYQWRFNGVDLPGATGPTLRLTAVGMGDAGVYSVVVSNRLGVLEGEVARLAVEPEPAAPVFLEGPSGGTLVAGTNAVLGVRVGGYPVAALRWQLNGVDIPGATGTNYAIPYVMPSHGGSYRVVASNYLGVAVSEVAVVTVEVPAWPTLGALWSIGGVTLGAPLQLTAVANGTPPIHVQWRRNGQDLPGVTGATLSLASFEPGDDGEYSVVLSNAFGVVESPGATLVSCPVAAWGASVVTNLPVTLSNAVAVAAGRGHALGLKADGTVVAWGSTRVQLPGFDGYPSGSYTNLDFGQLTVPSGSTDVVAIAAGEYHNLALKRDGTVVGWGRNDAGQASVPASATNVVAIGAGSAHSLALRADGTVAAWGTNYAGLTTVPASATNVVAIAAGYAHNLALRGDGTVVTWGGVGATPVPANATGVVAIAAGYSFSLAVRSDGKRVQWGVAPNYLAWGGRVISSLPTAISDSVGVAAGWTDALYLDAAGEVTVLTKRAFGPVPAYENAPTWFRNGVAVAAGFDFSLGLVRPSGGVPCLQTGVRRAFEGGTAVFAASGLGQRVGDCRWEFQGAELPGVNRPFLVMSNVQPTAAGAYTVRITDAGGTVRSDAARLEVLTPPPPQIVRQPVSQTVGAGADAIFSVATASGVPAILEWQFNGIAMAGETRAVLFLPAVQATHQGAYRVVVRNAAGLVTSDAATLTVTSTPPAIVVQPADVSAVRGETVRLSVGATGSAPLAYRWEREGVARDGADGAELVLGDVQPADAGGYRVIVTNEFGAVTSVVAQVYLPPVTIWGDRSALAGSPPVGASNLIAVSVGGSHVLGLRQDGQVVAWGTNTCGQATVPAGLSNVVQVAAGEWHSLALRSDGTVAGWGSSYYGGSVPATGLSNIVQVAAGAMFSLALDGVGNVYSWTNSGSLTLEPVSGAVAVAAGGVHRVALLGDGRVMAWGPNPVGQTAVPAEATNAVAVAAGLGFSAALRADGRVVAWGTFESSPEMTLQLGCSGWSIRFGSDSGLRLLPVPAEATNVVAIAAGRHHLVALRADGQVIAWGENGVGQTAVPVLARVVNVAAGGDISLALDGDLGAGIGTVATSREVGENMPVVVNLARAGRPPFGQRWQFGGVDLPGQTGPSLWLAPGQVRSGEYRMEVTNGFGAAALAVSLVVTQAPLSVVVVPGQQTVDEGADVVFTALVSGSGPVSYRWNRDGALLENGNGIEGVETATLTLRRVSPTQAGTYGVGVTSPAGSVTSPGATLAVNAGVSWLEAALDTTGLVWTTGGDGGWQWQTATTHDGVDAAVSGPYMSAGTNWVETVVTGPVVVGFWWQTSGQYWDRLGCQVDGIEQLAIGGDAAWQRRSVAVFEGNHTVRWVHVSQPSSRASSAALDEVVFMAPEAPAITTQPVSRSVIEGTPVTFSGAGSGTEPLSYRWQFNEADLPGATSATLALAGVGPSQAGSYRLVIANSAGSATSQVATLTVLASAPVVVTPPQSVVTAPGLTATFEPVVRGTTPMDVQWQFNRVDVPGANSTSLRVAGVGPEDAGWYRVIARNDLGTTFSAEASLELVPVAGWGLNTRGQISVPADVGDVVEIAAGQAGSLARLRDGSLRFWGAYVNGVPSALIPEPPSGPFARVSSNSDHHLALRPDGTVVAWGWIEGWPVQSPADLTSVVGLDAGGYHDLAVRSDGSVVAWGRNVEGQCAVPADATSLVGVAGGGAHSLGLREDGTVLAWGANSWGQTTVPAGLGEVVAIDAGWEFSLALLANGMVAAWGKIAAPPLDLTDVVGVAAGAGFGLALRSGGTVVAWGDSQVANEPDGLGHVVAVAGGAHHVLAVVGDGRPAITVQPFHRAAVRAGQLRLHVRAVGAAPLSYQWHRDGVDLTGASGPTLVLAGSPSSLAGTYTVRVANALGAVESTPCVVAGPAPDLEFDTAGGAVRIEADGLHLVLQGLTGRGLVRIWESSDLEHWVQAATHTPVVGRLEWIDPGPLDAPVRFYRATEGD